MLRRSAQEVLTKSPNDVVILSAVRSPIARAFKGGFRDSYPEELLMPVPFILSAPSPRTNNDSRSCNPPCNAPTSNPATSTTP